MARRMAEAGEPPGKADRMAVLEPYGERSLGPALPGNAAIPALTMVREAFGDDLAFVGESAHSGYKAV